MGGHAVPQNDVSVFNPVAILAQVSSAVLSLA